MRPRFALVLIWTLCGKAFAHDWPQFLGPNRDGVYRDADVKWPTALAWSRDVGAGFAGPVIAAGKVILFHRRGASEIVEAFEAATGKTLWTFAYPTTYRDDFGFDEGPRSAPTVSGGVVYTYGAQGMLHAVDLATGRMIWRVDAQSAYGAQKGFFGTACSPLVAQGKVFLNVGGAEMGVAAFDAATGKLKWRATRHAASYSSPILARFGVVFFTRHGIVVADPSTGKVTYELEWRARSATSVNAASPVTDGNVLFVSASYGTGAIALDFSTNPPVKLWSNDESLSAHYATPVLKDGYLYGLHGRAEQGQDLRAVELRTGKVAWAMETFGSGSVTLIRDKLMFLRQDGQIFQVEATPARLGVRGNSRPLEGRIRAFPAVGGGMVCVRDTGKLACLR